MPSGRGNSQQAYGNEKALWHLDKMAALRRGEQIVPTQVQLIISDFCSHFCQFCAYRRNDGLSSEDFGVYGADGILNVNPNRMIPTVKAKEILEDCATLGVKAIQFSVHGDEGIPVITPEGKHIVVPISQFVDGFFAYPCITHESQSIDGWKAFAINDDGDIVSGPITQIFRHPSIEDLYEVILEDGRSTLVTESHSLNVIRNGTIAKVPVSEIQPYHDKIACAEWEYSTAFHEYIIPKSRQAWASTTVVDTVHQSPELFRLMGYFTAEGTVVSRSLLWCFGNGPREDMYRADVMGCIEKSFGLKSVVAIAERTKKPEHIRLDSVRVQKFFIQQGAVAKANEKRIPQLVWDGIPALQMQYLIGLFSGDGTFRQTIDSRGYQRNSLHLKTASRVLANEVSTMIRKMGAVVSINKGINKRRTLEGRSLSPSTYYSLNVYDKNSLAILAPVIEAVGGTTKYANSIYSVPGSRKPMEPFGSMAKAVRVKLVERRVDLGRPIVYDLTVGDTHRFLLSSGVGCFNTGGGEPTVHPEAISIFGEAQHLGLETALVTHGALLKHGWDAVYPRMSWVRVSVDAGTPTTYGRIRQVKPTAFHQVLRHITEIRAAIDHVLSTCLLGAGYVITMENWHELYEGVKLIKDAGAHNIRLSAMFSKAGDAYYGTMIPAIQEAILKAMELQDDTFQVVDMFGDRISDLRDASPDYRFCGYEQFNMYIGGNQKIYRCCNTAYTHHGEVGDLSQQRLIDWFHSAQKQAAYGTFDARSCRACQFNAKNRAIVYAIDPAPVHVNFV